MQYDAGKALIIQSDIQPTAVMAHTPVETLKTILRKMGIECVDGLIREAYVGAFYDALIEDPSAILVFLPEDMIDFLIGVWECKDEILIDDRSYRFLDYLKMFGLLAYRKGNPLTESPNEIHVIEETRDVFYFYLKSRNSKKVMTRYSEWELIIAGMVYYYGIIEFEELYKRFEMIMGETDYEEFVRFINLRSSLWSIGAMMESGTGRSYYGLLELSNPDLLLLYKDQHKDLDYRGLSKDELIYVSEAGGIDNRWSGISELGLILVDEAGLNYYRATVAVRNFINMIHNGDDMDKLNEQMDILIYQGGPLLDKAREALEKMYYSIPIFEYKGYNRSMYEEIYRENQLKNKRKTFKIYGRDK